jgi:uncharacterized protein YndB with AHSA1/START domain
VPEPETPPIRWRLRLRSSPETVHALLATPEGRARFWATSAEERDGVIEFRFSNGANVRSRVLENEPGRTFRLTYFDGSTVTFRLADDGRGGTDLSLEETDVPPASWTENHAGWIAVLLGLKAAADFDVDLRSHDPAHGWNQGYVDV